MSRPLLFIGDPHGKWSHIFADLLARPMPGTAVIVGDLELFGPARVVLAPLLDAGWSVHWILGNHDCDTCQQLTWLTGEQGLPLRDLGGRVTELECVEVGGLSGVFKGRIWDPSRGEPPRYDTRAAWMRVHRERWRGGLPVHMRDTIFPEDFQTLERKRCDVLVCHEGASTVHKGRGVAAIDELAKAMSASLIVHGHHHHSGVSVTPDGIMVKSLGRCEIWEYPVNG